jgi:excinuclease ABC subunit C
MGQVGTRNGAAARFSNFGRSQYSPFQSQLFSMRVAHDFTEVRRAMRTQCPAMPGVYGVINSSGSLVYVGMSTALRKRLVTYFQGGSTLRKEQAIAAHAHRVVWELTGHELVAQLRELELIRRHQPQFNRKGRQPVRPLGYVYLSHEDAPRFRIARRVPKRVRYSWGPMPVNWRIRDGVEILNRLFKLSDCPSSVSMHFADQRHLFALDLRLQCLRGETGSCLGPCAGLCTFPQYAGQLRAARALVDGRDDSMLRELEEKLDNAVMLQQYERAAGLRDALERLQYLCDQLALLRAPPLPERFVYPLEINGRPVWYLIAGGTVAATAELPTSREKAAECLRAFESALEQGPWETSAVARPIVQIVSCWFRSRPDELRSILMPTEALHFCRGLAAARRIA